MTLVFGEPRCADEDVVAGERRAGPVAHRGVDPLHPERLGPGKRHDGKWRVLGQRGVGQGGDARAGGDVRGRDGGRDRDAALDGPAYGDHPGDVVDGVAP